MKVVIARNRTSTFSGFNVRDRSILVRGYSNAYSNNTAQELALCILNFVDATINTPAPLHMVFTMIVTIFRSSASPPSSSFASPLFITLGIIMIFVVLFVIFIRLSGHLHRRSSGSTPPSSASSFPLQVLSAITTHRRRHHFHCSPLLVSCECIVGILLFNSYYSNTGTARA